MEEKTVECFRINIGSSTCIGDTCISVVDSKILLPSIETKSYDVKIGWFILVGMCHINEESDIIVLRGQIKTLYEVRVSLKKQETILGHYCFITKTFNQIENEYSDWFSIYKDDIIGIAQQIIDLYVIEETLSV